MILIEKEKNILLDEHPRMNFFIRNLENSQWRVREESAEVLGEIGDKLAVKPLIRCLKDDEGHKRSCSIITWSIR
jgi:HEAT repeat protein